MVKLLSDHLNQFIELFGHFGLFSRHYLTEIADFKDPIRFEINQELMELFLQVLWRRYCQETS